ncbi:NAD-glutamate dehydrogenase [Paenarthrobacter sp. NPDC091711]|uniref:NAD-glutamate dehydrogenase n=1 Tax=Paenarthrobacter sp. NPDC091711 TaxID=3364385 RepID=UPI00382EF550
MSTEYDMEIHALPEPFLADYYAELSPEDKAPYVVGRLESRAAAHRSAVRNSAQEAWIGLLPDSVSTVLGIVCDDSPFLVDSVLAELTRRRLGIRLVVHPRFAVLRNADGAVTDIQRASSRLGEGAESWIAVELRELLPAKESASLLESLRRVLANVKAATSDWGSMRNKLGEVARGLPSHDKARNLMKWLGRNHFVFIGYREYALERGESVDRLVAIAGTGLGILRNPGDAGVEPPRVLTGAARDSARAPVAPVVTKARSRSTVHRDSHLDYIGVKKFNAAGEVTGEHRFLGLFTSNVYNGPVDNIPVVAEVISGVMTRSGLDPSSHSGRQLLAILETYPRDELFQIGVEELFHISGNIMRMQERRLSRVFLRHDAYGRFVTVLVYLPRDRYNTAVRVRIEHELREAYGAIDIEHEARVSSSALARIFFTVWTDGTSGIDEAVIAGRVNSAVRSWAEGVQDALRSSRSAAEAEVLAKRWGEAFPPEYQVRYSVEEASQDIERFHELGVDDSTTAARLYVDPVTDASTDSSGRIRLYLRRPESLSRILPYFEHLGLEVLEERPHEIVDSRGAAFYLYDLLVAKPTDVYSSDAWDLVPGTFRAVLGGEAESDQLNSLVLLQGFQWRTVALLRSYVKYLRQLGTSHSFEFVASTLQSHPEAARSLVGLFAAKFDPDHVGDRADAVVAAEAAVATAMDHVATLDAAFVLEALASLVKATVRTNFYQVKAHISTKFDPTGIATLPSPRPAHEIWVYSPRVEGVHLRFGLTARGGLRWSDRQEDFRTEVLGLVKAQTVKNAVIVPDGAKGGFYAKFAADMGDRAEQLAEGQECYRTFIRGLLDVTDNIRFVDGERQVVAPPDVVRYDGDDSYLVVAADKGTASFSDIANDVAASYDFWLGDAFASGGSVGYDHKRMGITARGAWESAKIHFSELGLDPRSTDFTVAGIGDMSGDVFGNGMLLSQHVRLVAAFDHRHIFLDPNPDAASSFLERARLFALPRSSWADYDGSLISDGGGVWPRTARAIPIHPAVRATLGLDPATESMSPPALLQAILKAPVDLLYNGGIGTYIKSGTESHADAGDRANDSIRVDGSQLRARVVVEGGNLGVTQAGRVEAALSGVLINTDAIDNSAGVDCSDHEVNIKILVDQNIRAGELPAAERTAFLEALTDEIAELVLTDNVAQNVLLLTDRRFPPASFPNYERLMQSLEGRGELDRELEYLPSTQSLEERISQGKGLTSPELSVLAAYAKNTLANSIRRSPLVKDRYLTKFLNGYFPGPVVDRLGEGIEQHPLREDIIATILANDAINMGGVTAVFRLMEETSADETAAVKAFVIASELFGLRDLSVGLVHLCADLPAEKWSRIYLDIRRVLDRAMRWFIQYDHQRPIEECVRLYRPVVEALRGRLPELLMGTDKADVAALQDQALEWGLPSQIGRTWAELREAFTLLDVARVQQVTGRPLDAIAPVYFTVRNRFGIEGLLERVDNLPRSTKWQAMARATLRDDVSGVVPELTVAVLGLGDETPGADSVTVWEQLHHRRLDESERLVELAPPGSFEALSAYVGTLRKAARA